MQPIISVVGKSDSGKTTLLEELIAEVKRRGYKVAVIKHSAEEPELDTLNKDTWRFSQAGSEVSAISSPHKLAIFKKLEQDISPSELSCFASWDCDIILTEGFKQSNYPKIEVHRKEQGNDLVSRPEQLLALVTDEPLEINVPQFARGEVEKIVDLIVSEMSRQQNGSDIDLFLNGKHFPVNQLFQNLLTRTLLAMTSGMKDGEEIKSMQVSLRRKA